MIMASSVLLGIDVGASKIEYGTAPRNSRSLSIDAEIDRKGLVDLLAEIIHSTKAARAGVVVPGYVDDGRVLALPNLPNVKSVDLRRRLQEKCRIPVYVENDVKGAALAVWHARGKRKDDRFLLVCPGSGIGTAIVSDGRLVRGAHNAAGEAGHMKLLLTGGRQAEWEKLCAGRGLEERMRKLGGIREDVGEHKSAKEMFASSDAKPRRLVEAGARVFGLGLANLANVLDPGEIVVAGGIGSAYMRDKRLCGIVRKEFASDSVPPVRSTPIRLSPLPRPALAGALLLAQGKKGSSIMRFLA